MPGMGGLETCRSIRSGSDIPVIILSVRNTEKDKVAALDAGADDYVTKPFGIEELLARIRAAMRRSPSSSEGGPRGYSAADLEIDFDTRKVRANGKDVRLTPKEFETAALPGGAYRPSRDPSRDSAGRVGSGLRRRTGISARVHQPASQEDRGQSGETEIHTDGALGGVPVRWVGSGFRDSFCAPSTVSDAENAGNAEKLRQASCGTACRRDFDGTLIH